jgi:hypothetical protein
VSDIVDTLLSILKDILGTTVSEANFINTENYGKLKQFLIILTSLIILYLKFSGKFLIAIDEMAPCGTIESLEAEYILKMSKLNY